MDASTLKALRGSIKKHEDIVAGFGEDKGLDNCPLCALFYVRECYGCPVRQRTGRPYCFGTPYPGELRSHTPLSGCFRAGSAMHRYVKAAYKAEVDFLKSLLPPECEPGGDKTEASGVNAAARRSTS